MRPALKDYAPQFGEHFERYREIRKVSVSDATLRSEYFTHRDLWRYLTKKGCTKNELELESSDLLDYAKYVNSLEGISQNTRSQKIGKLRPFYTESINQQWIYVNPMTRIPNPKREQIIPKTLTIKQMKELLSYPDLETVKGIRDRMIMELFYSLGIRKGELAQLKVDDFSQDYQRLKIRSKGGDEHVMYVGKIARHFSKFYIEKLRPFLKSDGGNYVFYSLKTGNPLPCRWIEKITKDYGKRLGLSFDVVPHVFRYSIASHLSYMDVDIKIIQTFMRHKRLDTTANYIKTDFAQLKETHSQTHPREI